MTVVATLFCLGANDRFPATSSAAEPAPAATPAKPGQADEPEWKSLFNGKDLKGWKATEFGGEGDVEVKDGILTLGFGNDLTGVTFTGEIPRIDYEVELEAQRVDGNDFFCGLTFPVGEAPCSLIVGGWGGAVCGLSSLDGNDAANNETASVQEFANKKWYRIRLRVTGKRIDAWIDGRPIVNQSIVGRKISIRSEVEPSKPFGLSSYQTTAALRNIRIRNLTKAELEKLAEEKPPKKESEND